MIVGSVVLERARALEVVEEDRFDVAALRRHCPDVRISAIAPGLPVLVQLPPGQGCG